MDAEPERRSKLRTFLVQSRARRRPSDVGLPAGMRRRVPGLRREEVAELAGVSSEWYRAFERGRAMRVSQQFVASLAQALALDPRAAMQLHILSCPELYEAVTAARLPSHAVSALGPTQLAIAQARYQRSRRDGAASTLPTLRRFLRQVASAANFEEAAGLAADTAQAVLRPSCITSLSLNRVGAGLWAYAAGPRSERWSGLHNEVAYEAHCTALSDGGVGSSEYLLSAQELAKEPTTTNCFMRSEHRPSSYEYICSGERWREFNATLQARSCILVPMFEGAAFRGILATAWLEPRKLRQIEIDAAQTIAAITALTTARHN